MLGIERFRMFSVMTGIKCNAVFLRNRLSDCMK